MKEYTAIITCHKCHTSTNVDFDCHESADTFHDHVCRLVHLKQLNSAANCNTCGNWPQIEFVDWINTYITMPQPPPILRERIRRLQKMIQTGIS